MTDLSAMLAEKGFTCIETDLGKPSPEFASENLAAAMMKSYESGEHCFR